MKDQILKECYFTADKILNILTELGYKTEKKPAYENLLRDLITIETRRNVNEIAKLFYNSITFGPTTTDLKKIIEVNNYKPDKLPEGFDNPANLTPNEETNPNN